MAVVEVKVADRRQGADRDRDNGGCAALTARLSSRRRTTDGRPQLVRFVRVKDATPEAVGNALRDSSDKIMDIYSIMGEWDLLVRIEHPD